MKKIKGKIFRRMTALFAAAAVWCAGLCLPVSAAETKVTDGISWSLDKAAETMTISGQFGDDLFNGEDNGEFWRSYKNDVRHIRFDGPYGGPERVGSFIESFSGTDGEICWTADIAARTLILSGNGPESGNIDLPVMIPWQSLNHLVLEDGISNIPWSVLDIPGGYASVTLGKDFRFRDEQEIERLPITTAFYVSSQNPYYASYKGVLYNKDYTKVLKIPTNLSNPELHPNLAGAASGTGVKWGWDNGLFYENGQKATGCRYIDGQRYRFDEQGNPAAEPERPADAVNTSGYLLGSTPMQVKGQFDWNPETKTLTLPAGARVANAIWFNQEITGTVTVQIESSASIAVSADSGVVAALGAECAGIAVSGGSLRITVEGNAAGQDIYGIRTPLAQNLTVQSTRLNVDISAVKEAGYSCAVFSDGSLTFFDSTISAKSADGKRSIAVRALDDFTLKGGSLTAQSGNVIGRNNDRSYGLWFGGKGQIAGKLTAHAGSTPEFYSYACRSVGVYAGGPTTISGAVQASYDDSYNGISFYYGSSLTVTGSLAVKNGSLEGRSGCFTLNGGKVMVPSGPITSYGDVMINSGSLTVGGPLSGKNLTQSGGKASISDTVHFDFILLKGGSLTSSVNLKEQPDQQIACISATSLKITGGSLTASGNYGICCRDTSMSDGTTLAAEFCMTSGNLNIRSKCAALTFQLYSDREYWLGISKEDLQMEIGENLTLKSNRKPVTLSMEPRKLYEWEETTPCAVDSSGNIVTNLQISG